MAKLKLERKSQEASQPDAAMLDRAAKNRACIELLQQWLADESGYDEATWPKVKQAIAENHTSQRAVFDE